MPFTGRLFAFLRDRNFFFEQSGRKNVFKRLNNTLPLLSYIIPEEENILDIASQILYHMVHTYS